MTAADKLCELLAIRPAMPNTEELVRWWRTTAKLVPEVLAEREEYRVELDRERLQHRVDIEGFEAALGTEAYEKSILEQMECDLRAELVRVKSARDQACEMLLNADLTISQYESARQLLEIGTEHESIRAKLTLGEPCPICAADPERLTHTHGEAPRW